MVYDWVSSNFYWTVQKAGEIWIKNGFGHRKVLLSKRNNPFALELDMERKLVASGRKTQRICKPNVNIVLYTKK